MESKEKLMRDPQWLDMNYERYYYIPWPDSQYFTKEGDEIVRVRDGVFVSMRSILEEECYGSDYD